jgi:MFS family permease
VRAVVLLCGGVLLVDTVFYAVLSPLLATYAESAGLDSQGVGLLVAAYPLGMVLGSLPAGAVAARRGPRVVLAAGVAVTAVTCVLFAVADTAAALVAFRLLQGVGGALSWTAALVWVAAVAPEDRRGELIGRILGLSVVGGMLGPAVGALAVGLGQVPVFGALAVLCVALGAAAWRREDPPLSSRSGWRASAALVRDRRVALGLWLTAVAGIGFGVVNTSAPLALAALGLGALATSAVFLVMAGTGAVASPLLGRAADRHGRHVVAVGLLTAGAVALLVVGVAEPLLLLVPGLVVAAAALEGLYVPGGALIVDGTADASVRGGEILALANLVWAASMALSSLVAGVSAQLWGEAVPYAVVVVLALGSIPWARGRQSAGVGS